MTFAPDGTLTLLDKYGWVWRATQSRDGSWQLGDKPFAHTGVGRPLGAAYDANGNLIYCDSLKVSAAAHTCSGVSDVSNSKDQPSSECELSNFSSAAAATGLELAACKFRSRNMSISKLCCTTRCSGTQGVDYNNIIATALACSCI